MKKNVLFQLVFISLFLGSCSKKMNREQTIEHFKKHQKDFEELDQYFRLVTPNSDSVKVSVSLRKWGKASVFICKSYEPLMSKKLVYVEDYKIQSDTVNTTLTLLNWDRSTVDNIVELLKKTDYKRISSIRDSTLSISMLPSGFVNSEIFIYPKKFDKDYRDQVHGYAFGEDDFLKRVYRITSSAL